MACGILVPRPGLEPVPPAMEALGLNHWAAREVPVIHFKYSSVYRSIPNSLMLPTFLALVIKCLRATPVILSVILPAEQGCKMVIHHILPFSCPLLQEETLITVLKQGDKFFDPPLGVGLVHIPFSWIWPWTSLWPPQQVWQKWCCVFQGQL